MIPIGAIGLGLAGIGAIGSAIGTAKSAKAANKAAKANAKANEELYSRQSLSLDGLINEKKEKLYNLGGIFDRFESTGAFGDTDTLRNLRQAQSDFSSLAAGDFTGFEAQLRKGMSDALINTVGSGSPIGAFAGLAADQQMNFRKEGIGQALSISDYLSRESQSLLGNEFGILDQSFNTRYQLDKDRVQGVNAGRSAAAATQGVPQQAFGTAFQQAGGSAFSYGQHQDAYDLVAQKYASSLGKAGEMGGGKPFVPTDIPSGYTEPARNDTDYMSGFRSTTDSPLGSPNVGIPVTPYGGWESAPGVLPQRQTNNGYRNPFNYA
jgi:hypothetical protein